MEKLATNLKESIPYGGQKTLANRLKVSVYTINRALNGGVCTPEIKDGIAQYMAELAEQKTETDKKIQQAIATLQS